MKLQILTGHMINASFKSMYIVKKYIEGIWGKQGSVRNNSSTCWMVLKIKLINEGATKRYLCIETRSSKSDHARLLKNEEYGATK